MATIDVDIDLVGALNKGATIVVDASLNAIVITARILIATCVFYVKT